MKRRAMIGQPMNRVDGPLKVSGKATYAFEHWDDGIGQPLYGFIVGATIGRGRVRKINCSNAGQSPGVRFIMTHENAPPQGTPDLSVPSEYSRAFPTLTGTEVHHFGEPVALVVADTLEQARAAANLVNVEYSKEAGRFDLAANLDQAYAPKTANAGLPTDSAVGDFDGGFSSAPVKLDVTYTTPFELAQPMEPHTCMAAWDGENVTVWLACQMVGEARKAIAATLRIDESFVHIVSPFTGGGFGSKLGIHFETILAILGARAVDRPVKIALTRQQVFQMVSVRPATSQRVRLGATRDGRLVALGHDVTMSTSPIAEYTEQTAATTRSLYAAPNRLTRHRLARVDLPRGEDVRAPGDAPGLLAFESAMDEMAQTLKMDPIEFRILNEPTVDPERNVPFSERNLVECMRDGARRFGWEHRPRSPGVVRDGRFLIGYGMASGIRMHFQAPTKVRVRMNRDRTAVVESDMTDIGTGTYTIITQVAADALGVSVSQVSVQLGNSAFPESAGSGGSWGASNSSVAVHRACVALNEKVKSMPEIPPEGVEAEGEIVYMKDDPNYEAYSISTYGAHFAEVGVDAVTGEIRVRRMLGVFSPGRILNHKTARSQLIGGMTFGISMALHEEAVVDTRSGAFANRDLAEYLVPVNADIPEIDVVFLDEFDDKANVLGVKGVGELGVCGSGAAVANAVFNATNARVRQFPITLDKLLPYLPPIDA
jgi:xanthine dehydrogenase YagR molybdenum-binding subunit